MAVPLEVELKLRVDAATHARLRRELAAAGHPFGPAGLQRDTFFAHPQREFAHTDEALRLREGPHGSELTYKGPRRSVPASPSPSLPFARLEPVQAKSRLEVNVEVRGDVVALLAPLGFLPRLRLEKRRAVAKWPGPPDALVALDDVTGVGLFVELEVLSDLAQEAVAQQALQELKARLGLQDAVAEPRSYLELAVASGAATSV